MKNEKILMRRFGEDGLKEDNHKFNLDIYGEMVPTNFAWMTPNEQRKRAEEIRSMIDRQDGKAKDKDLGFSNMGLK